MIRPTISDLRRPPWLTAGAVVMLAGGLVALGDSPASGAAYAMVRRGDVTATAGAAGTVQSADTRELVFGTSGTVTKVEVEPGSRVRAGQVLARLDDTAAKEQVQVAKAALAAAQDAYDKAQQGVCTGSGGSGASGGGTSGGSGGGTSGRAGSGSSGGSGIVSAQPAGYRVRPRPRRTPTPAPTPTPTSPTPTPTPTPTSPKPKPTSPRPTPTTTRPTRTPRPTPTGRSKPTGRPKSGGHSRSGAKPASGGRPGAGAKGGSGAGGGCRPGAVEQAAAKVTQADVDVRQAERTLSATALEAPMAGTVLSVAGTAGTRVGASGTSGFITLGDLSDLQVRAMFSLGDVQRLKIGQHSTIQLGVATGRQYTGTVTRIDPAATTNGMLAQFGVNISLDDRPAVLLIGMSATVEVVTAEAQSVLYVPSGAVRPKADGTATVLVHRDGRTLTRTVRLGVRGDRYVAVTAGLSSGDRLEIPTDSNPDGFPDGAFPGA